MTEFLMEYGYFGLFLISFLAATILPIGSEVFFAVMILAKFDAFLCLCAASIGNTLGGMLNYYLGRLGKTEWIEKYLKISHQKIIATQKRWAKIGTTIAFFSFMPVIGDLIPLALGYLRANSLLTALFMFAGKFLRYLLLIYGIHQGTNYFSYIVN